MSGKKNMILVILLVPFFLFLSSEEGESEAGGGFFAGMVVNFLLLFGGLGFLLYKPVRAFLQKKKDEIRRSLEEAESSRKDAEDRYKESMRPERRACRRDREHEGRGGGSREPEKSRRLRNKPKRKPPGPCGLSGRRSMPTPRPESGRSELMWPKRQHPWPGRRSGRNWPRKLIPFSSTSPLRGCLS